MRLHMFPSSNQRASLARGVNGERRTVCVCEGTENSAFLTEFCCDHKTVLKSKVYIFKI